MSMDTVATREAWLRAAIEVFRPRFSMVGFPLPEEVRISIGFGSIGARQENAQVLGVTYSRAATDDKVNEIFISPTEADTAKMLGTVLHELIHVTLDNEDGHGGRFAEIATRLGFLGPMTHTPESVELSAELVTVAAALGEYPGSALRIPSRVPAGQPIPVGPDGKPVKVHSGPGTQGTRMIKVSCSHPVCDANGYSVRTTRKWLDLYGAPLCPGSEVTGASVKPHRLAE